METASKAGPGCFVPTHGCPPTLNYKSRQADSEKEWTATRCNRLLRSLNSRIAILRKELSLIQTQAPINEGTELKVASRRKRPVSSPGDADWAHPRKKIKNTYSTRGGRAINVSRAACPGSKASQKSGKCTVPGDISVPTPLLHRARGDVLRSQSPISTPLEENIQSPNKRRQRQKDIAPLFAVTNRLRERRSRHRPALQNIYEGIFYGLEALLKTTVAPTQGVQSKGTRSLLSMCLRAIPDYIAREEVALEEQLEESGRKSTIYGRDVSTEIYDDLEAFGSSGHGWRHLRTVVRSHGIRIICKAVKESLVDTEFCEILVSLCLVMHAPTEAEELLSAMISTCSATRPKSVYTRFDDDPSTRPFTMLWKYPVQRRGFSFQYRQLSSLAENQSLPISWFATKQFVSFWRRVVQEFSFNSADPNAATLFATVLPLLASYGEPSVTKPLATGNMVDVALLPAVNQTFSSLISTLLAIVLLAKEKTVATEGSPSHPREYGQITTLFQTCYMQWKRCGSSNVKGAILALAVLSAQSCGASSADLDLVDILLKSLHHSSRTAQKHTPRTEMAQFVCSVARCCGRGASNSGFEYLQYLHTLLETLSLDRNSRDGKVLKEIIVDSAFSFARHESDESHLEYATIMEERFHVAEATSANSSPSKYDEGKTEYHWEEGISEWIMTTPAASNVESSNGEEYSSEDDSAKETPFHRSYERRPGYNARRTLITDLAPSSPEPDYRNSYGNRSRFSTPESDFAGSDSSSDDELDTPATSVRSSTASMSYKECESKHELRISTPPREYLEADELCQPEPTLSAFDAGRGGQLGRRSLDGRPRLNRKISRHSLRSQLWDDSDDELSCLDFSAHSSSGQGHRRASGGMPTVRNVGGVQKIPNRGVRARRSIPSYGDSEDELGM